MGSDKCFYNWNESAVPRSCQKMFYVCGDYHLERKRFSRVEARAMTKRDNFLKGILSREILLECFCREE